MVETSKTSKKSKGGNKRSEINEKKVARAPKGEVSDMLWVEMDKIKNTEDI